MSNMNLYRGLSSASGSPETQKETMGGVGWTFLIIIITLVVFGGAKVYKVEVLGNKMAKLDQSIEKESQLLDLKDLATAVYFEQKIEEIKEKLMVIKDADKNSGSLFSFVQTSMIPGVVAESIEYSASDKTILLTLSCDNFKQIASQIMSLKKSGKASDVRVDSIKRNDKGKIIFALKINKI